MTFIKKSRDSLRKKRLDRERYVADIKQWLVDSLNQHHIKPADVQGRVKHIYSIYRKMQKKQLDYDQLYDITAVRILVDNVEACYQVLDLVHQQWAQIPEEFDDYIATPKPNGYQSIHTVVNGPIIKISKYKFAPLPCIKKMKKALPPIGFIKKANKNPPVEARISWLRQVLDWQQEVSGEQDQLETEQSQLINEAGICFYPRG